MTNDKSLVAILLIYLLCFRPSDGVNYSIVEEQLKASAEGKAAEEKKDQKMVSSSGVDQSSSDFVVECKNLIRYLSSDRVYALFV